MRTTSAHKDRTLAALAAAGVRLADLVQSLDTADAGRPVPDLGWTAAETAAHVVTVAGRLLGDRRRSAAAEETGDLNAICLEELGERNSAQLAERLRADMSLVVTRVYPKVDFDRAYPFHGGTTISGGGGAAFLLCELLVHGYDIASGTGRQWSIPTAEAAIAVRGPAEFWMHLHQPEGRATVRVDIHEGEPVEFPVRQTVVDGNEGAVELDAVDLLLAEFGRTTASDERLAAVLGALPQM